MKKVARKLVIRSETVRLLHDSEFIRARGGDAAAEAAETHRTQSGINCPAQVAVLLPR